MKTITIDDTGVATERFSTIGIQNGSWHFFAERGNFTIDCYKGNMESVDRAFKFKTITVNQGDAYVLDIFSLLTKFVWFKFTSLEGKIIHIETYGEV